MSAKRQKKEREYMKKGRKNRRKRLSGSRRCMEEWKEMKENGIRKI
jgi:hypothetical protein